MITSREILWGLIAPAFFAAMTIVVGCLARRGDRVPPPWVVTLAIAEAFVISFVVITGKLSIPPASGQEFLPLAAVAAVLVSVAASVSKRRRWNILLSIALIVTAVILVVRRRRSFSADEVRTFAVLTSVVGIVWWIAMEVLATRMRGGGLPLLLAFICGCAALSLFNVAMMQLGKVEGAIAIVLLVIALLTFWVRELPLARGGILVVVIAGFGVLWCGYLFGDVKPADVAILTAAPVLAWIGEVPGVRGRTPRLRFAIRAVLVLGMASIVLVPALKGLRQTIKEQTESYQY